MRKLLQSPLIFLAVIVLTLAYATTVHFVFGTSDSLDFNRGIFGDSFGALTALFSGLGFAGLVYTLMMQGEQIRISNDTLIAQREQLTTQKEELEHTKKELAEQKTEERLARFESRFFQMLSFAVSISSKVDAASPDKNKGFFEWVYQQLHNRYHSSTNPENDLDSFFHDYEWQMGHYFRSIARIVSHTLAFEDYANFFIETLTSNMSSDQLRLLFYYSIYLDVLRLKGAASRSQLMELETLGEAAKKFNLFDPIDRSGINLIKESDRSLFRHMVSF